MRVAKPAKDGEVRRYLLAGVIVCGLCGRRMEGHWVHGRPGYRCRHGFTSARSRPEGLPRNLYVREDHLFEALPGPLERPAELIEQDLRAELVNRIRGQGLQIEYDGQRLELRPAVPLVVKTVEPARRPIQPVLALDWSGGVKAVEI
jgi:hypothetical protein